MSGLFSRTILQFLQSLGDDPPRDRTSELRVLGFPGRHLGSVQMTTDTALGVTKLVVCDKGEYNSVSIFSAMLTLNAQVPLEDIPYVVSTPLTAQHEGQ